MLQIYLDQNKWIDLSHAHHRTPEGARFTAVFEAARRSVKENRVRFPLSQAHYMETWNISNEPRRERLADTMWELAWVPGQIGPCTMLCPADVIAYEVETYLGQAGIINESTTSTIFGEGLGHVLNDPSVCSISIPNTEGLTDQQLAVFQAVHVEVRRACERLLLSRPPDEWAEPGPNEEPYQHAKDSFLKVTKTIHAAFHKPNVTKQTRREELAKVAIHQIQDIVLAELWKRGLSVNVLGVSDNEGRLKFVRSLPSRHISYKMLAMALDSRDFRPKIGDMEDLSNLSVATAYCNIVVSEKAWGHFIRQSKMDQEYGTTVLRNVNDLLPFLEDSAS